VGAVVPYGQTEGHDKAVNFCNFADVSNKIFRLKMNDKIQMQDNQNRNFTQSIILFPDFLIPLLLTQTVFDKSAVFTDTNYYSFFLWFF
jgi:hypothetical protein